MQKALTSELKLRSQADITVKMLPFGDGIRTDTESCVNSVFSETSSVPGADLNALAFKQVNPTGLPIWLGSFQIVDLNPA